MKAIIGVLALLMLCSPALAVIEVNDHVNVRGWVHHYNSVYILPGRQLCFGADDCITSFKELYSQPSQGDGGMDKRSLGRYLNGDNDFYKKYVSYVEYEKTQFCTLEQLEELNERIDLLFAMQKTDDPAEQKLIALKLKAERTGITQYDGNTFCTSDYCYEG